MHDSWTTFLRELDAAHRAFVRGDAEPYKALWSRAWRIVHQHSDPLMSKQTPT